MIRRNSKKIQESHQPNRPRHFTTGPVYKNIIIGNEHYKFHCILDMGSLFCIRFIYLDTLHTTEII
jgi:hypothetical protein